MFEAIEGVWLLIRCWRLCVGIIGTMIACAYCYVYSENQFITLAIGSVGLFLSLRWVIRADEKNINKYSKSKKKKIKQI